MLTRVHQHSTSNFPASAGVHWFAPPQSGQIELGSGFIASDHGIVERPLVYPRQTDLDDALQGRPGQPEHHEPQDERGEEVRREPQVDDIHRAMDEAMQYPQAPERPG